MKINEIEGFKGTGFSVRTTNAQEMNPTTSQIIGLWEKFYTKAFPKLNENSKVYGVYTNYESDFTGAFDVIACASNLPLESLDKSIQVNVKSGKYLTFSAKGEMPQVVINLWAEIWEYFSSDSCPHIRSYTTDFEFYKSEDEVEISISVK